MFKGSLMLSSSYLSKCVSYEYRLYPEGNYKGNFEKVYRPCIICLNKTSKLFQLKHVKGDSKLTILTIKNNVMCQNLKGSIE